LDKATLEIRTGEVGGVAVADRPHRHTGRPEWEKTFARFGRTLAALVLLVLMAIPVSKAVRTRLRYARAAGAQDLAAAAFAHFEEEAAELAEPRARSESAGAYVGRLLTTKRLSARAGLGLARIYERAEYSATGVGDPEAEEARRLARQLRIDLWSTASWWDKAERLFSPKSLTRRP
jgi:hypothetical protein